MERHTLEVLRRLLGSMQDLFWPCRPEEPKVEQECTSGLWVWTASTTPVAWTSELENSKWTLDRLQILILSLYKAFVQSFTHRTDQGRVWRGAAIEWPGRGPTVDWPRRRHWLEQWWAERCGRMWDTARRTAVPHWTGNIQRASHMSTGHVNSDLEDTRKRYQTFNFQIKLTFQSVKQTFVQFVFST